MVRYIPQQHHDLDRWELMYLRSDGPERRADIGQRQHLVAEGAPKRMGAAL